MRREISFPILKFRKFAYIFSCVIILGGLINIALHGGLKMGIDFAGGNIVQVAIDKNDVSIGEVRDVLISTGYGNDVQRLDDPEKNIFLLRTRALERNNDQVVADIKKAVSEHFGAEYVDFQRVDIVGPKISKYLLRTSYIIAVVAVGLILLYTSFRFRFRFGVTAVAALVHDVLVVLSFISFFGKEMDTFILAAVLTIIGYSLNDTIVIFDRARENFKSTKAYEDYEGTINRSILQSMSRTLITSATTLLAVIALYIFGGTTMKDFAFALIIGIIAGTYSTIFVASSLVADWHRWKPEKIKKTL